MENLEDRLLLSKVLTRHELVLRSPLDFLAIIQLPPIHETNGPPARPRSSFLSGVDELILLVVALVAVMVGASVVDSVLEQVLLTVEPHIIDELEVLAHLLGRGATE